jgi:hypothetical protein
MRPIATERAIAGAARARFATHSSDIQCERCERNRRMNMNKQN